MCPLLARAWAPLPPLSILSVQRSRTTLKEQRQPPKGYCLEQGPAFIPSSFFSPSKQALRPFLCKLQKSRRHASYKHVHNTLQQAHTEHVSNLRKGRGRISPRCPCVKGKFPAANSQSHMNAGSSEQQLQQCRRSKAASAGHLGDKRTENKMKTKKSIQLN